jgi:hypothetical protein
MPTHLLAQYGKKRRESLAMKMTSLFGTQSSAAMIGREYLRLVPGEGEVELLVKLICASRADLQEELVKADSKELRRALSAQQCQDFEDGRIVNIQGWLLAETEVRLCALVALNSST